VGGEDTNRGGKKGGNQMSMGRLQSPPLLALRTHCFWRKSRRETEERQQEKNRKGTLNQTNKEPDPESTQLRRNQPRSTATTPRQETTSHQTMKQGYTSKGERSVAQAVERTQEDREVHERTTENTGIKDRTTTRHKKDHKTTKESEHPTKRPKQLS